jgi:hypothetical protein
VRGKFCCFGKWATDPKGEAAQTLWSEQKDDLLAGRTSRVTTADEFTVRDLRNPFLIAKERQRDAGDIKSSASFALPRLISPRTASAPYAGRSAPANGCRTRPYRAASRSSSCEP